MPEEWSSGHDNEWTIVLISKISNFGYIQSDLKEARELASGYLPCIRSSGGHHWRCPFGAKLHPNTRPDIPQQKNCLLTMPIASDICYTESQGVLSHLKYVLIANAHFYKPGGFWRPPWYNRVKFSDSKAILIKFCKENFCFILEKLQVYYSSLAITLLNKCVGYYEELI